MWRISKLHIRSDSIRHATAVYQQRRREFSKEERRVSVIFRGKFTWSDGRQAHRGR